MHYFIWVFPLEVAIAILGFLETIREWAPLWMATCETFAIISALYFGIRRRYRRLTGRPANIVTISTAAVRNQEAADSFAQTDTHWQVKRSRYYYGYTASLTLTSYIRRVPIVCQLADHFLPDSHEQKMLQTFDGVDARTLNGWIVFDVGGI